MTMVERRLFLTPLSHFSRKVRIVLEELELETQYEYVPDLLSSNPSHFGGNPILRVPVLQDGSDLVVESDSIVRYLLEKHDQGKDRFAFFGMDLPQRNALAFVSAIMGAEVEILLSRRSGIQPTEELPFFERYFVVIRECLSWIESVGPSVWPDSDFSYLDIALICMWDHLRHGALVETADLYPWIEERTGEYASRPSVERSCPARMEVLQWKLYPEQRPADSD